jgi:cysteine-rich repeat protein
MRTLGAGSVVLGLLLWPLAAVAGPYAPAEHFQGDMADGEDDDPDRRAIVDDRGGQADGYTFDIEYEPADSNSENFCPHCRMTLLATDPGLDQEALRRIGVELTGAESFDELVDRIQEYAAMDPEDILATQAPDLTGPARDEYLAEITETLENLNEAVLELQRMAELREGTFDFASIPLTDLAEAIGIEVDSGFDASFDNITAPSSGIAVYALDEYVAELRGSGTLPDEAVDAIQASLDAIPYLTGLFELSGDDDTSLQPAVFHGVNTGLTVEQRTYAILNNNALLITYTVVNHTTRVFPLVELAMISDFEIPPASTDKSAEFDLASQAVWVYDELTTEDPVEHWWFGMAPTFMSSPPATSFVFANWHVDDALTLAQNNPSSRNNRLKFMLFHPDMSFDLDTATAKSEKEGAISLILPGPLVPGQRESAAFCYVGAVAGGSGAARTDAQALLEACKGFYHFLSPDCGNGDVEVGELCDPGPGAPAPPAGATCTADCKLQRCPNGRIEGTETCDDGNPFAGDGCGPGCQIERCGDGLPQPLEDCDDANLVNTDACLDDCSFARCGDGYLRVCTGPACAVCAGYEYCLSGAFTIDDTSALSGTSAFESMLGVEVQLVLAFDSLLEEPVDPPSVPWRNLHVVTGPVHVVMTGHATAEALAAEIDGTAWDIQLGHEADGTRSFSSTTMRRTGGSYGFSLDGTGVDFLYGRDRAPLLATAALDGPRVTLSRFTSGGMIPLSTGSGPADAAFGGAPGGAGLELCDDGNLSNEDGCTSACRPAECGDGYVQPTLGEECDSGGEVVDWCDATCRRAGAFCGNGTLDATAGEECDDGNTAAGDGCSPACLDECGDGVVQAGEECDDGRTGPDDGCTDECVAESCGDGVPQASEECDLGAANSDTGACTTACRNAVCGDGLVLAGTESCDGGGDSADCNADCTAAACGDGYLNLAAGEQCDDGNTAGFDGCSAACAEEFCGDRIPGPGEECDDGNGVDGDGCDSDCRLENAAACGNGTIDRGEQCDDGNATVGDGCSATCQLENPGACGNGRVDPGEGCDDGNAAGGDGCTSTCTPERCGDGIQSAGEGCDDGNTTPGDGCSASCDAERATCGNGVHEYGEQCDDGNAVDDDACSNACLVPPGSVDLRASCGNGSLDLGEQCDDGARDEGDGCDESCQLEAAVCGDLRPSWGEQCEDGNTAAGDGCGPTCLFEECGNGYLDPGEGCDDGNADDLDGCSAACVVVTRPAEPGARDGCSCGLAGGNAPAALLGLLAALGLLLARSRRRR